MITKNNTEIESRKSTEYDSAWKDVIEELFKHFLQFFFPIIYEDIDFGEPVEFLSNELRQIMPDSNVGKRLADVLVKVHLKDGTEKCICIFIHIEVQGHPETDFMERMYIYNYRSFDRHKDKGVEVISLAVLTDENKNYRPDEFRISRWGFELKMKIPMVKIIDYTIDKAKQMELEESTNPMTMVVNAQLKSYEAKKGGDDHKYNIKWELIRECYRRGYTKDQTRTLLKFIDWTIRVPEDLQEKLMKEIIKIEEEYKMAYVPTWERKAKEEGIKEGIKEGKLETAKELVKRGVDVEIIVEATGFSKEEIEKLAGTVH
jgi:predicted transposase/invertase (TIGR01784 family)